MSNDIVKFERGKDSSKPAASDVNTVYFANDTQIVYYKGLPYSVSGRLEEELGKNNIITDVKFADPSASGDNPSIVVSYIKPDGTFVSGDVIGLFSVDSSVDNALKVNYDTADNVYFVNLTINPSDKILSQSKDGLSAGVSIKKNNEYTYSLVGCDGTSQLGTQIIDLSGLAKESFLKSGSVVVKDSSFYPNDGDKTQLGPGTYICLVFALDSTTADGSTSEKLTNVYVDVDDLVETYMNGDGINIEDSTPDTDGGVKISIKLDKTGDSSSYLSLSGEGLKLNSNQFWTDIIASLDSLKTEVEKDSSVKVENAKSIIDNYTVNSKKISMNPVLASTDISLGAIAKPSADPISAGDAINVVIAKLQSQITNGEDDVSVLQGELTQLELSTVGRPDTSFGNALDNTSFAVGTDSSKATSLVQAIINVDKGITSSYNELEKQIIDVSSIAISALQDVGDSSNIVNSLAENGTVIVGLKESANHDLIPITQNLTAPQTYVLSSDAIRSDNLTTIWLKSSTGINSSVNLSSGNNIVLTGAANDVKIGITDGYSIPTNGQIGNWNSVYGWYSAAAGDTDSVIDNWNDVSAFLAGIKDSSNLETMLMNLDTNNTLTVSSPANGVIELIQGSKLDVSLNFNHTHNYNDITNYLYITSAAPLTGAGNSGHVTIGITQANATQGGYTMRITDSSNDTSTALQGVTVSPYALYTVKLKADAAVSNMVNYQLGVTSPANGVIELKQGSLLDVSLNFNHTHNYTDITNYLSITANDPLIGGGSFGHVMLGINRASITQSGYVTRLSDSSNDTSTATQGVAASSYAVYSVKKALDNYQLGVTSPANGVIELKQGSLLDVSLNFNHTHNYTDITNAPTKLSQFTNDSGYITSSGSISGNAGSATKLQTARTIWGQSFNGTGNITGTLKSTNFALYDLATNAYLELITSGTPYYIQTTTNGISMGPKEALSVLVNSAGNVGISTTSPAYKLDVNGEFHATSGYMTGQISFATNVEGIRINQVSDSNYVSAVQWYKGGTSQASYNPQIGQHNTGGDGSGSICILPYATDTAAWQGSVGLFIQKGLAKLDGVQLVTNNKGVWQISVSGSASSATTASKLGSSTIGSTTQPIYLNGGSPVVCNVIPTKVSQLTNDSGYITSGAVVNDVDTLIYTTSSTVWGGTSRVYVYKNNANTVSAPIFKVVILSIVSGTGINSSITMAYSAFAGYSSLSGGESTRAHTDSDSQNNTCTFFEIGNNNSNGYTLSKRYTGGHGGYSYNGFPQTFVLYMYSSTY